MKVLTMALLGVMLSASAASAQQQEPLMISPVLPAQPPGPSDHNRNYYVTGTTTKLTKAQAKAYYPARAAQEKVSGQAMIDCRVLPSGQLTECEIVDERPDGYGFGQATASMYSDCVQLDPKAVQIGPNSRYRIGYIWSWSWAMQ